MHYIEKIEEMNSKLVWNGWIYHGYQLPLAFAITSDGDAIANNCWMYLAMKKDKKYLKVWGYEKLPTIEEYCEKTPEKYQKKILEILKKLA